MQNSFQEHVLKMLEIGKKIIAKNPLLTKEVGTINVKGDKTIAMDVKMEQALIDYIKKNNLPVIIFSEEIGTLKLHPHPTHLIVFDPLDGSTNYKLGKNFLPYGLLIACYHGIKPKLKDIIAAGAVEYTTNSGWIYNGQQTMTLKNKPVNLNKKWEITRSTPAYFDLYRKFAFLSFEPLVEKFSLRWNGSTIACLLYVLNEAAAIFGSHYMRPEEIGAIVGLIKGAGGAVVDFQGKDLGEEFFSTEKNYPIIVGNKDAVKYAVKVLN